jgi:hypothetical protein
MVLTRTYLYDLGAGALMLRSALTSDTMAKWIVRWFKYRNRGFNVGLGDRAACVLACVDKWHCCSHVDRIFELLSSGNSSRAPHRPIVENESPSNSTALMLWIFSED